MQESQQMPVILLVDQRGAVMGQQKNEVRYLVQLQVLNENAFCRFLNPSFLAQVGNLEV